MDQPMSLVYPASPCMQKTSLSFLQVLTRKIKLKIKNKQQKPVVIYSGFSEVFNPFQPLQSFLWTVCCPYFKVRSWCSQCLCHFCSIKEVVKLHDSKSTSSKSATEARHEALILQADCIPNVSSTHKCLKTEYRFIDTHLLIRKFRIDSIQYLTSSPLFPNLHLGWRSSLNKIFMYVMSKPPAQCKGIKNTEMLILKHIIISCWLLLCLKFCSLGYPEALPSLYNVPLLSFAFRICFNWFWRKASFNDFSCPKNSHFFPSSVRHSQDQNSLFNGFFSLYFCPCSYHIRISII